MNIKWTKTYWLKHKDGNFRILTSEHESGLCYASLLYFKRKESFGLGEKGGIDFKHETTNGATEKDAMATLEVWVKKNLPGDYDIEPD